MNFSFSGCGFLGLYHAGVVCCIQNYAPHLTLNRVSGASAGAIAACALLCQQPLDEMVSQGLQIAKQAREGPLGPFSPSFDLSKLLADGLRSFLPEDAHTQVNGKLHISLTRVRDGKNVIISHFENKEDLIEAIVTSTFIPIFSGFIPPKFRGVRYIDGGFSNNLPIMDEHTITVSPFCGETDICPKDDTYQLYHININNSSIEISTDNIYRFKSVLIPPKPEVLSQLCKQGFEDTLRFLNKNNLLNCTRCLEVQSTFIVETKEECCEYDPECCECKMYQQKVLRSNMPEQVVKVFQEAIERANEGILNWIYSHRGMKMLSLLTLPYAIPADIMYATATKLVSVAPYVGTSLWQLGKSLAEQVSSIVTPKKPSPVTKISLHFSVAEYDGGNEDKKEPPKITRRNSKMDLNFTVNLEKSDIPSAEHRRRRFSTTKILSRTSSVVFGNSVDSDTFDHILDVTTRQDAMISYYYLDENNKMNVTEIFEMDENESNAVPVNSEEQIKQSTAQSDCNSNINHKNDTETKLDRESEEDLALQDQRPESDQTYVNFS